MHVPEVWISSVPEENLADARPAEAGSIVQAAATLTYTNNNKCCDRSMEVKPFRP